VIASKETNGAVLSGGGGTWQTISMATNTPTVTDIDSRRPSSAMPFGSIIDSV
jgi:hypothetical protein